MNDSPPRATTPTLLRILHHLTAHASSNVADALDQLSEALEKHPADASALRHARHRITRLFSSFLKHVYALPPSNRLSKPLITQLTRRFDAIADEIALSEPVVDAIRHAIRAVTTCGFALHLIRSKYAELVDIPPPPPSHDRLSTSASHVNSRVTKHYKKLFRRLIHAAHERTRGEFEQLVLIVERMQSRGIDFPSISRSLCHAVEKVVLHVVKAHATRTPGHLQHQAVHALGASIARKFSRRGFHENFTEKLAAFVRVMAFDEEVVLTVSDWMRKKKAHRLIDDDVAAYADDGRLRRHNSERTADYDDSYVKRRNASFSLSHKGRSRSFDESPLLGGRKLRSPDLRDRAQFLTDLDLDDERGGYDTYRANPRYDGSDHATLARLADMPELNPNPYCYPDPFRARPSDPRYEDREDNSDSSSSNSDSTSRSQWARVRRDRRAHHDDPRRQARAWSAGEEQIDNRRVLQRRGRSRSPKELYSRSAEGHVALGTRRASKEFSDRGASNRNAPNHLSGLLRDASPERDFRDIRDRFAQFSAASDDDGRGRTGNSLGSGEWRLGQGLGKLTSPEMQRWA